MLYLLRRFRHLFLWPHVVRYVLNPLSRHSSPKTRTVKSDAMHAETLDKVKSKDKNEYVHATLSPMPVARRSETELPVAAKAVLILCVVG